MDWYYADDAGGQHPVAGDSLAALVSSGRIRRDTLVWNETMAAWMEAGTALGGLFPAIPPPLSDRQRREIITGQTNAFSPQRSPADPVAICALVFGVLGLPICIPIFSIPAIICGHIGRRRARSETAPSSNGGLSLAGLIMGYVGFAVLIVVILFYVGIIGFAIIDEGRSGNPTSP